MKPSLLKYEYSTKNFHRFSTDDPTVAIREVYMPRHVMPKPTAELLVSPTAQGAEVPMVSKPVKA